MAQSWPINSRKQSRRHRTSWQIHRAVVYALFLREMKTRFGSQRLGYLWAVLQPASMILAWWGMYSLALRGGKAVAGVDFPMFLLTGFIPYGLFRSIIGSSMTAFKANKGLFNYRQVKPIDALLARILVECVVSLAVFTILVCLGMAIGFNAAIHDFLGLFLTVLLLVWFSFSLGLVFAMITLYSEMFPNIISFVFTPLLFISGVIIPISSIPEKYHGILFLNPVLHLLELGRQHYFELYESADVSYYYVFCWSLGCSYLGLLLYDRYKNRIIMSS